MFHVIMGLPGTGKSIAANFLGKLLPARQLRLDAVYHQMFARQGVPTSIDENTRSLDGAYLEMSRMISVAHRNDPKLHLVVEGGFRFVEQRKIVMNAIFKTGVDYSVLLLTARREIARNRVHIRHAAGRSPCSVVGYDKARADFEKIIMTHRIIDNSGSIAEMHNSLEVYLSELNH